MSGVGPCPRARLRGFSSIDLVALLVMVAVYFLVAIPLMNPPERCRLRINCVSNLKQVGLGLLIYSNDHEERFPWMVRIQDGGSMGHLPSGLAFPHFLAVSNEFTNPKILCCPEDTAKTRARAFDKTFGETNISYFLGMFADERQPETLLSGDRNMTLSNLQLYRTAILQTNSPAGWTKAMHNGMGNILRSDGSTAQVGNAGLRKVLSDQGSTPIRLLFP